MKPQAMTALEFRAELKRLQMSQSGFAAIAKIPLRTVQSWALCERAIPQTMRAVIKSVERMPIKDRLIGQIVPLLEKFKGEKLETVATLVETMDSAFRKMDSAFRKTAALEDQVNELKTELAALQGKVAQLTDTCVFQATKLKLYVQEKERDAAKAVPFNA
jgi:hypothetical protein